MRERTRSTIALAVAVVIGLIVAYWMAVTVRGTFVGAALAALIVLGPRRSSAS